jgi:3-hydroxyacyl-CoA dehydrogenase
MSKIALVGLGPVGRAWAIGFVRSGHEAALWDEKSDAVDGALRYAEEVLPGLASNGLLDDPQARRRVRGETRIADAPPKWCICSRGYEIRGDSVSDHPALAANRVAVVTGAASGIGLAASAKFAALGMKVCMADANSEALEAAAAKLRATWRRAILQSRRQQFR